jgi:hypothetical protein
MCARRFVTIWGAILLFVAGASPTLAKPTPLKEICDNYPFSGSATGRKLLNRQMYWAYWKTNAEGQCVTTLKLPSGYPTDSTHYRGLKCNTKTIDSLTAAILKKCVAPAHCGALGREPQPCALSKPTRATLHLAGTRTSAPPPQPETSP